MLVKQSQRVKANEIGNKLLDYLRNSVKPKGDNTIYNLNLTYWTDSVRKIQLTEKQIYHKRGVFSGYRVKKEKTISNKNVCTIYTNYYDDHQITFKVSIRVYDKRFLNAIIEYGKKYDVDEIIDDTE